MKLLIDTEAATLTIENQDSKKAMALYTKEAFEALSRHWVRLGWNQKYSYTFTWMGCPIIQLPEDVLRMQELIYQLKPDVIIETGVAHGGSLIFYASLCHAIGKGRVIGIDCEIRPHNRKRIETHDLAKYITLIEGDSVSDAVIAAVRQQLAPNEKVLVILDSNHTYDHVSKELQAYHPLVTSGSYLIVTDGIMLDLHDVPRGASHWKSDNPTQAAIDFVKNRDDFIIEQPVWSFNESELKENITYYPKGWLKKL